MKQRKVLLTQSNFAVVRELGKLPLVVVAHSSVSLLERVVLLVLDDELGVVADLHLAHGLLVGRFRLGDLHVDAVDLVGVVLLELFDLVAQLLDRLVVALMHLLHLVVVLQAHLARLVGVLGLQLLGARVQIVDRLHHVGQLLTAYEDLIEVQQFPADRAGLAVGVRYLPEAEGAIAPRGYHALLVVGQHQLRTSVARALRLPRERHQPVRRLT